MLYVVRCKCQHVEFDHRRKCTNCGKKFKNNGIMNKEYNVIEARMTSVNEKGEVFYDPLKTVSEMNKETRQLYFLQCPCGCMEFDDKRRCLECGKKFKNNFFRNDYMVVRLDWLIKENGVYYYKWDMANHKPMDNLKDIRDAQAIEQEKKHAKSLRRAERKMHKIAEENRLIQEAEEYSMIKRGKTPKPKPVYTGEMGPSTKARFEKYLKDHRLNGR